MIEEPGSFSGIRISPRPARGPEASQRTSLAIFMQRRREGADRAVGVDERVVGRERLELVGRGDEPEARDLRDFLRHPVPEVRGRVQSRADRGAAEGELLQVGHGRLDVLEAVVELRHPSRHLLAERHRDRVLEVRAADLDDRRRTPWPSGRASRAASAPPGISRRRISATAAMCMAVGKVSLEDWLRLTSSFGWTGFFEPSSPPRISIARFAMTSLAFMLVCVPLPVCQTTSGKWSSSSPAMTSSAALDDRLGLLGRQRRRARRLTIAAGLLEDAEGADDLAREASRRRS